MVDRKKDVIRETDAAAVRLAKTLIRGARFGALAVIDPETGAPLASRVGVATDSDGAPLILVSMLSAHTGALLADPRCSLLVGEPGKG
ncbi:MAG: HugZ family protein, partial [Mesorhizobium sp.]